MSVWSGDLFVFKDGEGQEYISADLHTGDPTPASAVKRYRASGPYMPISGPAPTAVDDADAWMSEKRKAGFAFEMVVDEDYSKHFSEESFWDTITKYGKVAGREVFEKAFILYFVFNDPNTPAFAKGVVGAALGYLILPLDAIPDFIPFAGYADDLGVILMAIAAIAACITQEHRDKAKAKTEEWFGKE